MGSLLASLATLFATPRPAHAQVEGPTRMSVTGDNDLMAGTDRHYTNGLRAEAWGSIRSVVPVWRVEWGLALGQRIYTPERLEEEQLVVDDRPYAGWTYLRLSLRRRDLPRKEEDLVELSVGIVGPASGAEETHRLAHRVFGSRVPRGWGHQLRDEPAVTLSYRGALRLQRGMAFGLGHDVTPHFRLTVGNLATHAGVGVDLRAGLHLPDEYQRELAAHSFRLYLEARTEARLVGYDIFLDGNLLRSGGHHIDKELVVADVSIGVTVTWYDRLSFTYLHTFRTPEFRGQRRGDQFGSLSMTLAW